MFYSLLEQAAEDRKLATAAAQKGLDQDYRSQAKTFLELNQKAREQDKDLLTKWLDAPASTTATPLGGLLAFTSESDNLNTAFCIWVSLLLDLLPLFAISTLTKATQATTISSSETTALATHEKMSAPRAEDSPSNELTLAVKTPTATRNNPTSSELPSEPSAVEEDDIVHQIRTGQLEPNYKAVRTVTGWTQWRAQEFFKKLQSCGVLQKDGRSFRITSNIAVLEPKKPVSNR
jgi:hypothetical protein